MFFISIIFVVLAVFNDFWTTLNFLMRLNPPLMYISMLFTSEKFPHHHLCLFVFTIMLILFSTIIFYHLIVDKFLSGLVD